MSKLFTPVTFGPLTLRNRTIRSAAFESMCPGNAPSQMLLDYHRSVAAGGIGMTTVAYAAVTQSGLSFDRQLWMRPEFIPVGQIVNAHGIRGEVKLNPAGFDPAFLAAFDTLYIGGKETKVKSARVHKSTVLLVLPGVEDMDAALALKGKPVFIRRTDAHLPEGEYFDAELEGLTVLDDENGEELGRLTRVLNYPAHKVYEVRGKREYLIPAVREVFIRGVDMETGTMRVRNMKGLATDED